MTTPILVQAACRAASAQWSKPAGHVESLMQDHGRRMLARLLDSYAALHLATTGEDVDLAHLTSAARVMLGRPSSIEGLAAWSGVTMSAFDPAKFADLRHKAHPRS